MKEKIKELGGKDTRIPKIKKWTKELQTGDLTLFWNLYEVRNGRNLERNYC